MRVVLNISITQMVYREAHNASKLDDTCSVTGPEFLTEREGFHWSEQLQGVILGAFYWGYVSLSDDIIKWQVTYTSY